MNKKNKSRYAVYKTVSNDTLVLPPVPLPSPRLPKGPRPLPKPKIDLIETILTQQINQMQLDLNSSKGQLLSSLRIVQREIVDDIDPEATERF